jgi:hypothetical protein
MRLAVRDFGTGLDFNGSSSVVTSSSSVVLSSGNCLMFRFKPKSLTGSWLASRNLAVDPGDSFRMSMSSSGTINVYWENVEGTSTNAKITSAKVNVGSWNYVAVYTTGSTINIYLNGTLLTSPIIGTLRQASGLQWGKVYIGQYGTFIGDDLYYFNSYTPTQSDLDNFYYGNAIPSGATLIWKCDEGTGTAALDSSGNGNDGTITGATYTSDVPMKARTVVPTSGDPRLMRRAVGGNMVLNGDFEYAPPFTAATTAAGRYVDGSASGSTTNTLFGSWALIVTGGFSSAQFDTAVSHSGGASFKLSTTGASGSATAGQGTSTGFPGASDVMSARPSTSYTLIAWIKTSNVATNSAFVEAREYAGDGTQLASTASTQLSGTNDWTKTTLVFTTNANTRYIRIFLRNNVVGNISDAWFDDIDLRPTLPVTRALAGNRTLA